MNPRVTLIAILATILTAAGCGGSGHPNRGALPKGTTTAAVKQRLEQIERKASVDSLDAGSRAAPLTRGGRSRSTKRTPRVSRPVVLHVSIPPPRRPYAAGRLTATYRVTLRGGAALTPPGPYPHASGSVVLKIYGHTETCWAFRELQGIKGPTLSGVASGANGARGLISGFATTFAVHGCETGIPAGTLTAVERHPGQYSVLVEDRHYYPSLVGAL